MTYDEWYATLPSAEDHGLILDPESTARRYAYSCSPDATRRRVARSHARENVVHGCADAAEAMRRIADEATLTAREVEAMTL